MMTLQLPSWLRIVDVREVLGDAYRQLRSLLRDPGALAVVAVDFDNVDDWRDDDWTGGEEHELVEWAVRPAKEWAGRGSGPIRPHLGDDAA